MQLRKPALLLTVIGVSRTSLSSVLKGELDVFTRATSDQGLLCIRKYWDSHCSVFQKLPALALLQPGSCPRGLAPSDCVALLGRLTDLRPAQLWELWDTLDVRCCGLLGCPEFTLVVVLLCAALSQQQLRAAHAYAGSIARVFTGAHVASSYVGLAQCCQLLGLPRAQLCQAMQLLQPQQPAQPTQEPPQQLPPPPPQQQQCQHSSLQCSAGGVHSVGHGAPQGSSSRHRGSSGAHSGGCSIKHTDSTSGGNAPITQLGCSCCTNGGGSGSGPQQIGCTQHQQQQQPPRQQWACDAAAHRAFCAHASVCSRHGAGSARRQRQHAALLAVQDVQLVLYRVIQAPNPGRQQQCPQQQPGEEGLSWPASCCRIC